ncbi:MAG TPA: CRISPR-associated protein Cas4 [Rickettsiales bacterium]|nr:CRISPR-associated protein Cas4 [Rickettsiales bacterium]
MESKKLILSIYNISEYLYCQKSCFYKIFNFEENQEQNIDMIVGRNQHEIVHSDSIRTKEKGLKQISNLSIFNHEYSIAGKLDLLEIKDEKYYPIEYKKGKFRDFLNHKIQLCLQTLCLEEMYKTKIEYGYLFFIEEHRRYKIIMSDELRKITKQTVFEIREKLSKNNPNLFIKNKNELCSKCSFFQTCLPFIKE